jgi:hypothetical protein
MARPRTVDLDALLNPNVSVTFKGKNVPVKPIDGTCFQLLTRLEGGEQTVELMYEIIGRCLPSLSKEEVLELTPIQAKAVIELVSEGVREVEALAPPNSAPAGVRRKSQTPSLKV